MANRRGSALVWLVVVLSALIVAAVVIAFVMWTRWRDAEESAPSPIKFQVTRVVIGYPQGMDSAGDLRTFESKGICITFQAWNATKDRKVTYTGYGSSPEGATLTDDLGNSYEIIRLSRAVHPWGPYSGRAIGRRALNPGDPPLEDFIWFEPPVPSATKLTLRLPKENVGGAGYIEITFPPPKREN